MLFLFCQEVFDFYPRPPRGGRLRATWRASRSSQFLSTPSARRATRQMTDCIVVEEFLSTPSARRATIYADSAA